MLLTPELQCIFSVRKLLWTRARGAPSYGARMGRTKAADERGSLVACVSRAAPVGATVPSGNIDAPLGAPMFVAQYQWMDYGESCPDFLN